MGEAYIVDAIRTPVGKRGGGLADEHPADLGAHAIKGLIDRTGIDPLAVDDVIMGCLDNMGPQAGDIARTAWLAAGMPEAVPGAAAAQGGQGAAHPAGGYGMGEGEKVIVL